MNTINTNMDPTELMQQLSMMMTSVPASAASVQKFTSKAFLIKCQKEALKHMPNGNNNVNTNPDNVRVNEPNGLSNKDLNLRSVVDISALTKSPNKKLEGKFLLCRTITPPCKMSSLVSVVEDFLGEQGVRIAIYNYTTPESNANELLPLGQILAIKNPIFKQTIDGGFFVRVDGPSDITFLTNQSFQNNFPGLKWKGEIPKEYQHFLKAEKVNLLQKTVEEWKNEGNRFFVEKKYEDAVNSYTEALKISPNVDILANRSAAYINLEYFIRALEDCENALKIEPNHLKGIFRKARCLGEMKRYEDGVNFLRGKISNHPELKNSKEITNLLAKLKRLKHEGQTGTYDIAKLFQNPTEFCKEVADFVGPVKIENIPGKGRGLVVTEKVLAGRLLLVSKAFAIVYPDPNSISSLTNHDKLVHKIANKLKVEPEHGQEIYQLYAGTDMNSSDIDFSAVDEKRIDRICTYNCFGGNIEKLIGKDKEAMNLKGKDEKSTGVWIWPAYINHSCWNCNAFWMTFGDIMIVRACKNISPGEEILMPYINPTEPYEKRKILFRKHDFICDCIICDLDRSESEFDHQERKFILEEVDKNAKNQESLISLVSKLESMREAPVNVSIVFPLRVLGLNYFRNGQFENAAKELAKAHDIMQNSPLVHFAANYAQNIVTAFIYENHESEIKKWVDILKRDLLFAYGSLQVIKTIGQETYSKLQQLGISFD